MCRITHIHRRITHKTISIIYKHYTDFVYKIKNISAYLNNQNVVQGIVHIKAIYVITIH